MHNGKGKYCRYGAFIASPDADLPVTVHAFGHNSTPARDGIHFITTRIVSVCALQCLTHLKLSYTSTHLCYFPSGVHLLHAGKHVLSNSDSISPVQNSIAIGNEDVRNLEIPKVVIHRCRKRLLVTLLLVVEILIGFVVSESSRRQ